MGESPIDELADVLSAHGSARSPDECSDLEQWRREARAAARQLRRPVETIVSGDGAAYAVLRDWPRDEAERIVHMAALRRVVIAASDDPLPS